MLLAPFDCTFHETMCMMLQAIFSAVKYFELVLSIVLCQLRTHFAVSINVSFVAGDIGSC